MVLCLAASAQAPPPPALEVAPRHLSFAGDDRAEHLAAQRVTVRNGGGGQIVWRARASDPWILLSPDRGLTPATLVVSIDAQALGPGVFSGSVVVASDNPGASPQNIEIDVAITSDRLPGPPPPLTAVPDRINCAAPVGDRTPRTLLLHLESERNATVKWVAHSDRTWATLTPAQGVTPADLAVVVSPGALPAGEHHGSILIRTAGRGEPIRVPVTCEIQATGSEFAFAFTELPAAAVNAPYAQALPIRGGRPPYTFQLAGSLPADLTLADGVVSGTPRGPGTFSFTVTAVDSSDPPATVNATFTLTVRER